MINILSKEEISHINDVCKKYNIEDYTINSDGSIDVDGYVNLNNKNLFKLPLKFGKVRGSFDCGHNNLTSFEGCPESVSGYFYCYNNKLTSLEFSPTYIGGEFICYSNKITSLEGCAESVGGDFNCSFNELTSLKGCPSYVGGDFYCFNNNLPGHFRTLYNKLSSEERKIFFKYQDDLRIWEGEYNEESAHDLYEEIKDGML